MTLTNTETMLKDLAGKLRALGAAEGKGSASRPEAALLLADQARAGLIAETYAETGFMEYAKGTAEAAKKNVMVTYSGNEDQKSAKQQISKFRQFIKAGALTDVDGPVVLRRAVALVNEVAKGGVDTKSVFDAMLDTARAQIKTPDTTLTDDEIRAIVMKPGKVNKSEIEKLIAVYKTTRKIFDGMPDNAHLEAACDDLKGAIVEAGGEVPPLNDEEKEEAAALAFLAKRGMLAVRALPAS